MPDDIRDKSQGKSELLVYQNISLYSADFINSENSALGGIELITLTLSGERLYQLSL